MKPVNGERRNETKGYVDPSARTLDIYNSRII
jgi:hypothetical protein